MTVSTVSARRSLLLAAASVLLASSSARSQPLPLTHSVMKRLWSESRKVAIVRARPDALPAPAPHSQLIPDAEALRLASDLANLAYNNAYGTLVFDGMITPHADIVDLTIRASSAYQSAQLSNQKWDLGTLALTDIFYAATQLPTPVDLTTYDHVVCFVDGGLNPGGGVNVGPVAWLTSWKGRNLIALHELAHGFGTAHSETFRYDPAILCGESPIASPCYQGHHPLGSAGQGWVPIQRSPITPQHYTVCGWFGVQAAFAQNGIRCITGDVYDWMGGQSLGYGGGFTQYLKRVDPALTAPASGALFDSVDHIHAHPTTKLRFKWLTELDIKRWDGDGGDPPASQTLTLRSLAQPAFSANNFAAIEIPRRIAKVVKKQPSMSGLKNIPQHIGEAYHVYFRGNEPMAQNGVTVSLTSMTNPHLGTFIFEFEEDPATDPTDIVAHEDTVLTNGNSLVDRSTNRRIRIAPGLPNLSSNPEVQDTIPVTVTVGGTNPMNSILEIPEIAVDWDVNGVRDRNRIYSGGMLNLHVGARAAAAGSGLWAGIDRVEVYIIGGGEPGSGSQEVLLEPTPVTQFPGSVDPDDMVTIPIWLGATSGPGGEAPLAFQNGTPVRGPLKIRVWAYATARDDANDQYANDTQLDLMIDQQGVNPTGFPQQP